MLTPAPVTFDLLLRRFPASARAEAEVAMLFSANVEVIKTYIAGTTRLALVVDGRPVAIVRVPA